MRTYKAHIAVLTLVLIIAILAAARAAHRQHDSVSITPCFDNEGRWYTREAD